MERHPNEMWLLFDCNSSTHKKTRALARTITRHINEFPLANSKLSKLRWAEILLLLNLRPKDILNKSSKDYQEKIAGHDFSVDNWLEILRENPCLIKGPIAIMNDRAVLCINPKDIYKLQTESLKKS